MACVGSREVPEAGSSDQAAQLAAKTEKLDKEIKERALLAAKYEALQKQLAAKR